MPERILELGVKLPESLLVSVVVGYFLREQAVEALRVDHPFKAFGKRHVVVGLYFRQMTPGGYIVCFKQVLQCFVLQISDVRRYLFQVMLG